MARFLTRLKTRLLSPFRHRRMKSDLAKNIEHGEIIRVIISPGGSSIQPGWCGTEYVFFDMTKAEDWARTFPPSAKLSRILSEHVFEHLTLAQSSKALELAYRHLMEGGLIRIAVPDGNNPNPEYIEQVRPGGAGPGAADHKMLWTKESLAETLEQAGFRPRPLEWFDQDGTSYTADWDPADGFVHRSVKYGKPNATFPDSHRSLIIDGLR